VTCQFYMTACCEHIYRCAFNCIFGSVESTLLFTHFIKLLKWDICVLIECLFCITSSFVLERVR
jgi:hypothetical protein